MPAEEEGLPGEALQHVEIRGFCDVLAAQREIELHTRGLAQGHRSGHAGLEAAGPGGQIVEPETLAGYAQPASGAEGSSRQILHIAKHG